MEVPWRLLTKRRNKVSAVEWGHDLQPKRKRGFIFHEPYDQDIRIHIYIYNYLYNPLFPTRHIDHCDHRQGLLNMFAIDSCIL